MRIWGNELNLPRGFNDGYASLKRCLEQTRVIHREEIIGTLRILLDRRLAAVRNCRACIIFAASSDDLRNRHDCLPWPILTLTFKRAGSCSQILEFKVSEVIERHQESQNYQLRIVQPTGSFDDNALGREFHKLPDRVPDEGE
jgi:hypothetical protein